MKRVVKISRLKTSSWAGTFQPISFRRLRRSFISPYSLVCVLTRILWQGFYEALEKGSLSGNAISGCLFVLKDGGYHVVDSSELAFRNATIGAFREAYQKARPVILEPIMTVEVVAPVEFQSVFSVVVIISPEWL